MSNMNNTTSTNNNILNNAVIITREDVLKLNQRQTIMIETNYKDGEVVNKRVFLGNFYKRSHCYYDLFIAGGFLYRRKQHEYRLLKLFRALEELEGFEAVEWVKLEQYLPDPKPVVKPQEEAAEATATKVTEDLSNDETAAEQFGEVVINEVVATIVEEPKKGKKTSKKGGNKKK